MYYNSEYKKEAINKLIPYLSSALVNLEFLASNKFNNNVISYSSFCEVPSGIAKPISILDELELGIIISFLTVLDKYSSGWW